MNRNEIIEKIHASVDQMDDKALVTLASFTDFLNQCSGVADLMAETRAAIEHNEREAARQRYDWRQKKIQDAAGHERQILNQIELAKKRIHEEPDTDFTLDEADYLIELSINGPQLASDAYLLGYSRGLSAAGKE